MNNYFEGFYMTPTPLIGADYLEGGQGSDTYLKGDSNVVVKGCPSNEAIWKEAA